MAEAFPAKSVAVRKRFDSECLVPGCGWCGLLRDTYAEANADREAHLKWHRQGCPDLLVAPQVAARDDEIAERRRERRGHG